MKTAIGAPAPLPTNDQILEGMAALPWTEIVSLLRRIADALEKQTQIAEGDEALFHEAIEAWKGLDSPTEPKGPVGATGPIGADGPSSLSAFDPGWTPEK